MKAGPFPVIVLLLAGCSADPSAPLPTQPSSVAYSGPAAPPQAPDAPREPAAHATIIVGQIGHVIGADGGLAAPEDVIPVTEAIHAMALFEGKDGETASAELRVYDGHERQVGGGVQSFVLDGRTRVMWEVKPARTRWAPGPYRALFLCGQAPCWEVRFSHQ